MEVGYSNNLLSSIHLSPSVRCHRVRTNSPSFCYRYSTITSREIKLVVFTMDHTGSGLSEGEYVSLGHFEKDDITAAVNFSL